MDALTLSLLLLLLLALVGAATAWHLRASRRLPPPRAPEPEPEPKPERKPDEPPPGRAEPPEPEPREVPPPAERTPLEELPVPVAPEPTQPEPEEPEKPGPDQAPIVVPLLPEPAPRPRPRRAPPPWYPVVLVHGVLGFDALRVGFFQPQYFRGVAEKLRQAGSEVHVARVSPVAGIGVRAAQLAAQVRAMPAERVNLVAHSMGGLDARYAISRLGLADKVASLTTVGTPHRGTPIADSGVWLVQEQLRLRRLLQVLGIDAFAQLTTDHLETFNEEVTDMPGVHYACCPARVSRGLRGVNSLLAAGYVLLEREAGDNDGVVPTTSQRWGDVLEEIDADHWAQVGWSTGFDAVGFYDQIVRALRRRRL